MVYTEGGLISGMHCTFVVDAKLYTYIIAYQMKEWTKRRHEK